MEVRVAGGFLVFSILISCFAATCYGVNFSALKKTLDVSVSPTQNKVLKAGVDTITVTWAMNITYQVGTDSGYTTVEAKLCYAPVNQTGQNSRITSDNLDKDRTCPFDITDAPYSFIWTVPNNIPTATFFVRVYAMNAENHEVAFGQTTDPFKATSLFQIENSSAWPTFGNSFGYRYAWLLMLFLLVKNLFIQLS